MIFQKDDVFINRSYDSKALNAKLLCTFLMLFTSKGGSIILKGIKVFLLTSVENEHVAGVKYSSHINYDFDIAQLVEIAKDPVLRCT
jgi:hypothetical protein